MSYSDPAKMRKGDTGAQRDGRIAIAAKNGTGPKPAIQSTAVLTSISKISYQDKQTVAAPTNAPIAVRPIKILILEDSTAKHNSHPARKAKTIC
tara:strand:- start:1041 stop:1322 length:282 start_codon:yes stop_codon:yes gene_type:complete